MSIDPAVVRQALHPMAVLPDHPWQVKVERPYVLGARGPFPLGLPQPVEPRDVGPDDVEAAVEDARALAREDGHSGVMWWIGPEHRWMEPHLVALGLEHRAPPGSEPVLQGMALTVPLAGPPVTGVELAVIRSYD